MVLNGLEVAQKIGRPHNNLLVGTRKKPRVPHQSR